MVRIVRVVVWLLDDIAPESIFRVVSMLGAGVARQSSCPVSMQPTSQRDLEVTSDWGCICHFRHR